MKSLHVIIFVCFSVVCVWRPQKCWRCAAMLEERSPSTALETGTETMAPNTTACVSELCSSENILIQTEWKRSTVISQGRYSIKNGRGDGVFNVAIKKFEKADAGKYRCRVEKTISVFYREINLIVVDASTVAGFPPSATTIPQPKTALLSQDSFTSSTEQSPAASSPSDGKRSKQEASRFTDTTVVIIVSGSLALLVCAIIPIIFYGHWRSNAGGPNRTEDNKGGGDHCEENAVAESAQVAVGLQAFESDTAPETDADTPQYVAIYQALDPQTLN